MISPGPDSRGASPPQRSRAVNTSIRSREFAEHNGGGTAGNARGQRVTGRSLYPGHGLIPVPKPLSPCASSHPPDMRPERRPHDEP